MNAPGEPTAAGLGRQDTDQTSPESWIVETAARAPMSHTLMLLSADLLNGHQTQTYQLGKHKKHDSTWKIFTLKALGVRLARCLR